MCAIVGGWLLSGCDYACLKGMRADFVGIDVKGLIRGSGLGGEELLRNIAHAWSGDQAKMEHVQHALAEIACAAGRRGHAMKGSRKATALELSETSPKNMDVLRASWTLSYWCLHEFADTTAFGFYFD